jgi:glycosyltransferase involved in cell wall biosynthesis
MKILILAPLAPPYNGQSVASSAIVNHLEANNEIRVINFAKNKNRNLFDFIYRFLFIFQILIKIYNNRKWADRIYITISESFLGNLKDIFFYILLYRKLNQTTLHLHGGAGMINILDPKKNKFIYIINSFFLKQVKNIIILGQSQVNIFSNIVCQDKIRIVQNFADNSLFLKLDDFNFHKKLHENNIIEILYLSNLIESKGYKVLIESFLSLNENISSNYILNLAGEIRSEKERIYIHNITTTHNNIRYHGIVKGEDKRKLLFKSHIFCLPTYYEFEGQPISILESYASGCFVITTNHSGIKDIFCNTLNGYFVTKKSINDLKNILIRLQNERHIINEIGKKNISFAMNNFTKSQYCESLTNLILN